MKLLVTGGAGFIGTNFVYAMVKAGHEVIVLDKLTYAGGRDNLDPLGASVTLIEGDVCDRDLVRHAVKNCDWAVHFAAESHNTRSETDPDIFYRTNVEGTRVMLEEAFRSKVNKFLHISCYDEKTRAFTKEGLKRYTELSVKDQVLTINPETKQIEWCPIEKVIVQEYTGEMIAIKNKRINLLVTPNHRMLVEAPRSKKLHFIQADTLLQRAVTAFPQGEWTNDTIDAPTEAWFYFLGFFIGDGFLSYQEKSTASKTELIRKEWLRRARNANGQWERLGMVGTQTEVLERSYRIFLDVPESDAARSRLESALDTLGYKWHAQKGSTGEHIYLTKRDLYPFLSECGKGAKNKKIPPILLNASRPALQALLEGLIDSDGRWQREKKGAVLTTASLSLVYGVIELCAKLGYTTAIKQYHNISYLDGRKIEGDCFVVSIGVTPRRITRSRVASQPYSGKIWCVRVPHNRNLLVEREGKLIFCGNTDEVYGSIQNGYFREEDKEEGDHQATSAYSKSKSLADDLAMDFGRRGYPVLVTRTTNNFGPWQFPEKALPRWITNLLSQKKIPLWGEGKQVRDWLYAEDNAQAIAFLLEKGSVGEAYNVAANHQPEITNRQAAEWLCRILSLDPEEWIEHIPDPRPNHDFRYALNTEKLQAIGWRLSSDPYEQFRQTVAWYQEHSDWWQRRKAEAERIY